jgi:hypothetical protein
VPKAIPHAPKGLAIVGDTVGRWGNLVPMTARLTRIATSTNGIP